MDISEEVRTQIGERIQRRRQAKYGTKRAAYSDAAVNPTTWDRIEQGLPVREDRLRAAVKLLWPETEGDWRRIPAPSTQPEPNEADLPARVSRLEARVAALEAAISETTKEGEGHVRPAATSSAGVSLATSKLLKPGRPPKGLAGRPSPHSEQHDDVQQGESSR
jgi:hypothetical protein